jgi:uncharacterized phage infection (PIP) family protein YhgE
MSIADLTNTITQRDKQIEELNGTLEDLNGTISSLNVSVSQSTSQLSGKLHRREEKVLALTLENQKLIAESKRKSNTIQTQHDKISEQHLTISEGVIEAERLKEQIGNLLSSRKELEASLSTLDESMRQREKELDFGMHSLPPDVKELLLREMLSHQPSDSSHGLVPLVTSLGSRIRELEIQNEMLENNSKVQAEIMKTEIRRLAREVSMLRDKNTVLIGNFLLVYI